MAQRLGFDVEIQEVEWGEGVPLAWTEEVLRADSKHEIKAILACHNETATGVTSDIAGLRRVMDDEAISRRSLKAAGSRLRAGIANRPKGRFGS